MAAQIMVREEQAVSTDAVRAELGRILESPHFDASERNRHFLTYVVEETLAGRTDRIKAYTIATEVFGRDPKFDPQLDSIVRIEAGRLRRSLERYYLTDGRTSPLRIDIPRGGYAPVFVCADPVALPHSLAGSPRVLVTAFEEEGDQSSFPTFTRGFTRSLIIALTRFTGLRVFGAETALRHPADIDPNAARRELAADYLVTGQTSLQPDRFEVDVLLVEAASGRAVWAEAFERRLQPSEIIALRNEVANRVARALAQPYGAIQSRPRARRRRTGSRDARQLRGGAPFLRLLADLRPRDDRGGPRRPRARRGDRARLCRGARLPVAGLLQRLPLPPSRSARPTRTRATGPSRSPPVRSSSRQTRAGRATPSASPAGSPATPPAPSMRWRPAAG